jgi:hypothetical protein
VTFDDGKTAHIDDNTVTFSDGRQATIKDEEPDA